MIELSISVVTYNNNFSMLKKLFESLSTADLKTKIFVVDNSPQDSLRRPCSSYRVEYLFNGRNVGYGAGHNIAINKIRGLSRYHLVINPDVYFEEGTLKKLYEFMERNPDVGLVMPKILYPDGSLQYLCRLLPSPIDLFVRRFSMPWIKERSDHIHALKFTGYGNSMEVPYLSGCFMFIRNEVFDKVGLFDERFFMYMEDVDLARRINKLYKNIYFPGATIYHMYKKESYNNYISMRRHIKSAILYFNKYGWFWDNERDLFNKRALEFLRKQQK